jgi:hypothetical protein
MRGLFARAVGKHGGLVHETLLETDALPVLQVNLRIDISQ